MLFFFYFISVSTIFCVFDHRGISFKMYLIQVQCQRDRPLINVILRHQCAKYIIVSSLDIHFLYRDKYIYTEVQKTCNKQ